MFPWLWFWAPQVHLPWSGNVAQRIDPDTHWFFQGIPAAAGHAEIEEQAFHVASYGKQLGLITEVLLDLAGQCPPGDAQAQASRAALQDIASRIETLKQAQYTRDAATSDAQIERQLRDLHRTDGERFARLAERLRPLLAAPLAP